MRRILLAGCGDIGLRVLRRLPAAVGPTHCFGVRRQPGAIPDFAAGRFDWLACDLSDRRAVQDCTHWPDNLDMVIATPVPSGGDYRDGFVEVARNLTERLEAAPRPPWLFWTSSTAVYQGVSGTAPIDESTEPAPTDERARLLLEAEQIVTGSGLPHCILRPAGIYGPGRTRLLKRARQAPPAPSDRALGNRIHSEDVAGAMTHLAAIALRTEPLKPLYLLTDGHPTPRSQIIDWLRQQLQARGQPLASDTPTTPSNPRGSGLPITNRALLQSGYRLQHPDWKKAWLEMLDS